MMSSSFCTVAAATGASTQAPFWMTWREAATRKRVGAQILVEDRDGQLDPLARERGLAYQSVMITPPLASAWSSGANDTVSTAARHR